MGWKRIIRAVAVVGIVAMAAACGGGDDDTADSAGSTDSAGASTGAGGGGGGDGACVLSPQTVEEVVGDINVENVERDELDPASSRPQDQCEYFTRVTNEEASLGMTGVVRINVVLFDDSDRGELLLSELAEEGESLDVGEDGAVAGPEAATKLGDRYVGVYIHPNTITEEDERAADLLRAVVEELD